MGKLLHVVRSGQGVTGQGATLLAYSAFFSFFELQLVRLQRVLALVEPQNLTLSAVYVDSLVQGPQ